MDTSDSICKQWISLNSAHIQSCLRVLKIMRAIIPLPSQCINYLQAEEREQRYGLAGWHYMFDVHNPELTDPPPSKQLVVDATHM